MHDGVARVVRRVVDAHVLTVGDQVPDWEQCELLIECRECDGRIEEHGLSVTADELSWLQAWHRAEVEARCSMVIGSIAATHRVHVVLAEDVTGGIVMGRRLALRCDRCGAELRFEDRIRPDVVSFIAEVHALAMVQQDEASTAMLFDVHWWRSVLAGMESDGDGR